MQIKNLLGACAVALGLGVTGLALAGAASADTGRGSADDARPAPAAAAPGPSQHDVGSGTAKSARVPHQRKPDSADTGGGSVGARRAPAAPARGLLSNLFKPRYKPTVPDGYIPPPVSEDGDGGGEADLDYSIVVADVTFTCGFSCHVWTVDGISYRPNGPVKFTSGTATEDCFYENMCGANVPIFVSGKGTTRVEATVTGYSPLWPLWPFPIIKSTSWVVDSPPDPSVWYVRL